MSQPGDPGSPRWSEFTDWFFKNLLTVEIGVREFSKSGLGFFS
jgi:hypothetical protein